jgi:hypothetical protein
LANVPVTPAVPPSAPAIPLIPQVRAAYLDLYNKFETAIENTRDPGVHAALLASQSNVDDVLTKDDLYKIEANTSLYSALLDQINGTNSDLDALQGQILAISSGVSTFGDILAAISKVLTLVPGA